jgi:tetratricopeptide (TPR) repeat protein
MPEENFVPPPAGRPAAREARRWRWALAGTLVLTLLTFGLALSNRFWPVLALLPVYSEWSIWLVVLAGLGLTTLLAVYGIPATFRGWRPLILLGGWLLCVAVLYFGGITDLILTVAADLILRVTIVALWSVAGLGLPWTAIWVWRHRRPPRPPFRFGRWWFATLVLLLTAEPLMAIREWQGDLLHFPARLSAPPPHELRIASIGDSTMVGHPYEPKFGIPQVLAWRVRQMYPQRTVVIENLALPGQNLPQAIDRLQRLQYRPHLLLVYSGHNEFFHELEELGRTSESRFGALDALLNHSPTFRVLNAGLRQSVVLLQLKSGVQREFIEPPIAGRDLLGRRQARFRRQLEQLARFGRERDIPMLWFVPAASESGFEPNRSWLPADTPPAEVEAVIETLERGRNRERAADWPGAVELYRSALARHPEFAEFHFRLGECQLKLDRPDEARRHFQEALENDGHPVRATAPYRTAVSEVAEAFSIPVVVTGEALREDAPLEILDRSLFHDNVHPTLRGFYLIGIAGARVVADAGLLEPRFGVPAEIPPARFADAVAEMHVDRQDVAAALRRVANGMRWLARLRYDRTGRNRQADENLRVAEKLEAGQIEPGEEGSEALR